MHNSLRFPFFACALRVVIAFVVASFVVLSTATMAHAADDTPAPQTPHVVTHPRCWYGWKIILADGLATLVGLGAERPEVAVPIFLFGAPAVHFVHGESDRAGGSFALRLGIPLVGGLLGFLAGGGGYGSVLGIVVGGGGGMAMASLIDTFALAYEDVPAPSPARPSAKRAAFRLVPGASVMPRGGMLGLSGSF